MRKLAKTFLLPLVVTVLGALIVEGLSDSPQRRQGSQTIYVTNSNVNITPPGSQLPEPDSEPARRRALQARLARIEHRIGDLSNE